MNTKFVLKNFNAAVLISCALLISANAVADSNSDSQHSAVVTQGPGYVVDADGSKIFYDTKVTVAPPKSASEVTEDQDPASGGPPMLIDDTGTVDKGHLEVITAVMGDRSDSNSRTDINPTVDVNYGATENVQLHLLVPYDIQLNSGSPNANGLGDAELGVKYRFYGNPNSGFSMLVFPRVSFNLDSSSARSGLVDKGTDVILPLNVQKVIDKFTVGGEIGYDFRPTGPNKYVYGVSGGVNATKRVQLLVEVLADSAVDHSEHEAYFNLGCRIKANSHLNFIFSAGHSVLSSAGTDQFIYYIGLQNTLDLSKK